MGAGCMIHRHPIEGPTPEGFDAGPALEEEEEEEEEAGGADPVLPVLGLLPVVRMAEELLERPEDP